MVPAKSWWRRTERYSPWLISIAALAVVAILLAVLWSPGGVTFSGFATSPGNCRGPNCPALLFGVNYLPAGPNVTVHWTDVTGGTVAFRVWSPLAQVCYETGGSGVCSFVSVGGNYTFTALVLGNQSWQRVNYTGTYA
jgi:hypothetical protein